MKDMKLTVTQKKREEVIDKILKLVESEFEGVEVTALFTKTLLEETIMALEVRCYEAPLKIINQNTKNI